MFNRLNSDVPVIRDLKMVFITLMKNVKDRSVYNAIHKEIRRIESLDENSFTQFMLSQKKDDTPPGLESPGSVVAKKGSSNKAKQIYEFDRLQDYFVNNVIMPFIEQKKIGDPFINRVKLTAVRKFNIRILSIYLEGMKSEIFGKEKPSDHPKYQYYTNLIKKLLSLVENTIQPNAEIKSYMDLDAYGKILVEQEKYLSETQWKKIKNFVKALSMNTPQEVAAALHDFKKNPVIIEKSFFKKTEVFNKEYPELEYLVPDRYDNPESPFEALAEISQSNNLSKAQFYDDVSEYYKIHQEHLAHQIDTPELRDELITKIQDLMLPILEVKSGKERALKIKVLFEVISRFDVSESEKKSLFDLVEVLNPSNPLYAARINTLESEGQALHDILFPSPLHDADKSPELTVMGIIKEIDQFITDHYDPTNPEALSTRIEEELEMEEFKDTFPKIETLKSLSEVVGGNVYASLISIKYLHPERSAEEIKMNNAFEKEHKRMMEIFDEQAQAQHDLSKQINYTDKYLLDTLKYQLVYAVQRYFNEHVETPKSIFSSSPKRDPNESLVVYSHLNELLKTTNIDDAITQLQQISSECKPYQNHNDSFNVFLLQTLFNEGNPKGFFHMFDVNKGTTPQHNTVYSFPSEVAPTAFQSLEDLKKYLGSTASFKSEDYFHLVRPKEIQGSIATSLRGPSSIRDNVYLSELTNIVFTNLTAVAAYVPSAATSMKIAANPQIAASASASRASISEEEMKISAAPLNSSHVQMGRARR